MAVPEQTPFKEYIANGITTVFPLEFDCDEQDHLIVLVDDLEPITGSWYFDHVNDNVIFITPPKYGAVIKIRRDTPMARTRDYQSFDNSFRPPTVNNDFDSIWRKLQELGVLNWLTENNISDLNEYVNSLNDETRQQFFEALAKAGLTMSELNQYVDSLFEKMANIAVDKGWLAEFVVDGTKTQKEINALQIIHNKSSAAFTDYLTRDEIDQSETTDLSLKLQAINDANLVSKLRFSKGIYYLNSPVTFNRDFDFDFDPDAWLKMGPNGYIKFEGSAELIGKPVNNISSTSRSLDIGHNGKLKPFDLICIYNPIDYSFSPHRNYYRAGEFIKVFSVSGSAISLAGKPYADYNAADVDVYKIHPISIEFNRFNVIADSSNQANPVSFTFCEHLDLSKYINTGSKTAGVSIDRCYDVWFSETRATNNSALVGLNYGISIANCQNVRITGGSTLAARHCVTTGGGIGICSVPCREIFVSNAVLKTGSTANIAAADFHGNAEYCSYNNCIIDHASLGGRNNSLNKCTIFGRDLDGAAVIMSEISGGVWNIVDCNLVINANLGASRGAIDIVLTKDAVEELVMNISNLTINGKSNGNGYLVKFITSADVVFTKKLTFNIDIKSVLSNHLAFLHVDSANPSQPVLPNVEINMSNIKSVKKGIYYVHPTATTTASTTKLSLPTQRGSLNIATAGEVTGVKQTAIFDLPYYYPVTPGVLHSLGTDGTWAVDSSFNNKPISVITSTNTPTQLRFALVSKDTLPDGKNFKISYSVGLEK